MPLSSPCERVERVDEHLGNDRAVGDCVAVLLRGMARVRRMEGGRRTLRRCHVSGSRRILSIDGGGIKGALPIGFLARVEEITGERIVDHFDLIAGTSTGGIIA